MKFIPGSLAGVLIYVAIPTSYILDVAFLGTEVGLLELVGVAIIVVANMLIGLADHYGCFNKKIAETADTDKCKIIFDYERPLDMRSTFTEDR